MSIVNIPIQHLGTEEAGKVPDPSVLIERQLAMNMTDKVLYSKNAAGVVVKFGVSPTDLATVATTGNYNDLNNKPTIPPQYVLMPASETVLGGVMVGQGLSVQIDGLIAADVLSVRGQDGTAQTGTVVITRQDLGLDILDANDRILPQYLPDSITGAMVYKGTWDASTNTPTIPAADAGNLGWLYVVSVAGTTPIDGTTSWNVADWLVSDGTKWQKVAAVVATVTSVNGQTGDVIINAGNLPDLALVGKTNQYSDLSGIPLTFTPKPHTHTIADVTNAALVATTNDYNDLDNLPPDPAVSLVGFNANGAPVLLGNVRYPFPFQVKFAQNFASSYAYFKLYTGSTAIVQLNRIRAGVSTNIGSIQYTLATDAVTWTSTETEPTFEIGDLLEWVWPSNIAQFSCNMVGRRAP